MSDACQQLNLIQKWPETCSAQARSEQVVQRQFLSEIGSNLGSDALENRLETWHAAARMSIPVGCRWTLARTRCWRSSRSRRITSGCTSALDSLDAFRIIHEEMLEMLRSELHEMRSKSLPKERTCCKRSCFSQ